MLFLLPIENTMKPGGRHFINTHPRFCIFACRCKLPDHFTWKSQASKWIHTSPRSTNISKYPSHFLFLWVWFIFNVLRKHLSAKPTSSGGKKQCNVYIFYNIISYFCVLMSSIHSSLDRQNRIILVYSLNVLKYHESSYLLSYLHDIKTASMIKISSRKEWTSSEKHMNETGKLIYKSYFCGIPTEKEKKKRKVQRALQWYWGYCPCIWNRLH